MSTWYGEVPPPSRPPLGIGDWLRVLRRGLPIAVLVFGGLGVLVTLRVFERPLWGTRRPVTSRLTTAVCRGTLVLMGLDYRVKGRPMRGIGAQVANHASWLDIFVLNACQQVCFVSKSEVADWPGIGWLARATGTLFITRDRRDAAHQTDQFRDQTLEGRRLVFFPEGTSSDGFRVLHFKTTLFAAFFSQNLKSVCSVQPVSVIYTAPPGADPRAYGWWGDMEFADHLLQVLALPRQGAAQVVFHPPIPVAACADRKDMARRCEEVIRTAHDAHQKSAITS